MMADAAGEAPTNPSPSTTTPAAEIPVDIVTEEEMALIELALSAAAARRPNPTKLVSLGGAFLYGFGSRRSLSVCSSGGSLPSDDIEDAGGVSRDGVGRPVSLLQRYRWRRALAVTDITSSEWCEKRTEFVLIHGKPEKTLAMKAGSSRHAQLEEEVVKKVEVRVQTIEDIWAKKLASFIVGVNQLLFEGLTREIPIIVFVEGVWISGIIDEVRMLLTDDHKSPSLVETKTRERAILPSEAQKRNSRFQLMCYKYLWDGIVVGNFPFAPFFHYFNLDSQISLSDDVKQYLNSLGLQVQTLGELVIYFRDMCCSLPFAHDELVVRYEFQGDHSLIGEDNFLYDKIMVENHIQHILKFWKGLREADYVIDDDRWKCRHCSFATSCPMINKPQEMKTIYS